MRRLAAAVAVIGMAIALPAGAAVTGLVIGTDGAPMANVRVVASSPQAPFPAPLIEREAGPLAVATTDAKGAFTLDVPHNGVIDVKVRRDGFVPADVLALTDESVGTIVLRAAPMVEGRVTADGKPVANATVLVSSAVSMVRITTGADGRYRIPDPRLWAESLIVTHPDFAPAVQLQDAVDFALQRGRRVSGKVVDAKGHPVAGALVDVDGLVPAKSAGDGTFTIAHVHEHATLLRARSEKAVVVAPFVDGSPVLHVASASTVSGVVRDTAKHPLAGIIVALTGENVQATAVTDAAGAFAFEGVPRGSYALSANAATFYEVENADVDTTGGDVKRDLAAKRLAALDGRVVTSDGAPVIGAAIYVVATVGQGQESFAPTGVVSGAGGAFRIRSQFDPTMSARLVAIKAGMPPGSAPLVRPHATTIAIPNGVPVEGVVTSADGKPLAGVQIRALLVPGGAVNEAWAVTGEDGRFNARLEKKTNGLQFAKKGFVTENRAVDAADSKPVAVTMKAQGTLSGRVVDSNQAPVAGVAVGILSRTTNSAGDGSFAFDDVDPGPVSIRYGEEDAHQMMVIAPAADVTLVVAAYRTIHGRVVDAATGAPVGKFALSAVAEPATLHPFEAPNGEFELRIPDKAPMLRVQALGYLKSELPLDSAQSEPVVVQLSRGRRVRGRVVNEEGEPIEDAAIMPLNEAVTETRTSADGTYELSGLSYDAESGVSFSKAGLRTATRTVKPGTGDATLDVTMERGITVTGRVVNANGAGVTDLTVNATSAGHGTSYDSQAVDADGAFRFENLAAARYDFLAERANAHERGTVKDVDVTKVHDVTIRLETTPSSTIAGRVTGIDPVTQQISITATNNDGDLVSGVADSAGNYRITSAPSGLIEVYAATFTERGTHMTKKMSVEAPPGGEVHVDLAFAPQATISGHVTGGGKPLPSISIAFTGTNNGFAVTGTDGSYVALLDPGEYEVTMRTANERALPIRQRITVGEKSQFDFQVDGAKIAATVVDADSGQPIAGAVIHAVKPGQSHDEVDATTGADGIASFEVLPGEPLTVIASMRGYANSSENLTPSDAAAITLRLRATPGTPIRIVDMRDGSTLTGNVLARDASGRVIAAASDAGSDGTVSLPLAPGKYQISASAEGYGSHTIDAEVPNAEIRVPLPRGGTLALRSTTGIRGTATLIQPDGQPYVRCWCNGVATIEITTPITLIDRIAPGQYTLEIKPSNAKSTQIPIVVTEGQTKTIPID
jgi:carboxypeptidase family protein